MPFTAASSQNLGKQHSPDKNSGRSQLLSSEFRMGVNEGHPARHCHLVKPVSVKHKKSSDTLLVLIIHSFTFCGFSYLTLGQLWSENIKRKILETNNSGFKLHAILSNVM